MTRPNGDPWIRNTSDRLFHSADRIFKPNDRDNPIIRLTAIADRLNVAKKFIHALPAWVMHMFGIEVFQRWIKPAYDLDLDYYTFHVDDEGIWTGGWTRGFLGFAPKSST